MSGFFSDLAGIRKPEVIMNMGPLPSQSLPSPYNAHTDAKINYGSTLLGDVRPYTYGQPSHLQDQTAFYAVPHKVPKIVPELRLPEARNTDNTFLLSHGVDDGDVAFTIRVDRVASTIDRMHTFDRMELSHTVDPQINLATVNYLLAGIQRYWNQPERVKWQQFMVDIDFVKPATSARTDFTVQDAIRFITDVARPFGVVIGSEKQGGTHEGSLAPVTFAVNFITTLAVCGRVENVVHMWREHNISAGDDLIFKLEYLPICSADGSMEYVLNHWRKGMVRQRFDWDSKGRNWGWQLVPAVCSAHPPRDMREGYDYREHGYWHIARTQVMRAAEITHKLEQQTKVQGCYYDDSRFMRGGLLEVTFEPVFVRHKKLKPHRIVSRGILVVPPPVAAPPRDEPPSDPPLAIPERKRKKVRFAADPPPDAPAP
jgi:hypothetical protein